MIDKFHGVFRFLSNFHLADIEWEGQTWPSTEHAFQAAKTNDPDEREKIRTLDTPGKAKRAGRRVTLREDWESVKVSVMEDLVRRKFTQNSNLGDALLETNDEELVEGNTWNDTFWGVCKGKGQNNLGKILMKIRAELRETK